MADFPRERVVEVTLSPAVRGLPFHKSNDKPKRYLDQSGDAVPFERARDAVIEAATACCTLPRTRPS